MARKPDLTIYGFHGTTKAAAKSILENSFEKSSNEYDWLGDGVYFFQDSPQRATQWCFEQDPFGEHSTLGCEISLENCLDLVDGRWTSVLKEVYETYVLQLKRKAVPIPRQTEGAHRLDRAVINKLASQLEDKGIDVYSVRGVFVEGHQVYPESAIYDKTHIQIAVRNTAVISNIWEEAN